MAYFRVSCSYACVRTKKPSKSPGLIGLFRPGMGLNPIYPGGGPYGPPARKSAVSGRKNENFQKWMDGKSPPQAPQPHLYPTISLYLLEPLLNRLWNVQVAYFRLSSSYVRVSTKKPSNSPWLIGLFRPSMRLNPINHGGGAIWPPSLKIGRFR